MSNKPTMDQIAKVLGLSRMTVSTVINHRSQKRYVATKTEKIVLSYLDQIGYVRNYHAMRLKIPTKEIVGIFYDGSFIVSHVTQVFSQLINETLSHSDSRLELKIAPPTEAASAIEELIGRGVTHLAWIMEQSSLYSFETIPRVFSLLEKKRSAIYNFSDYNSDFNLHKRFPKIYALGYDRTAAFQSLAQKLKKFKHKRICIPQIRYSSQKRILQYFDWKSIGIEVFFIHPENLQESSSSTYFEKIANEIIYYKKEHLITAAIFLDDEYAARVLSQLTRKKIMVPQDLSITGMDNSPILEFLPQRIDTIGVPVEKGYTYLKNWIFSRQTARVQLLEMKIISGETLGVASSL